MNKVSAQQAYLMLKNGDAILIDVREADEFMEEHIPYASSIPLSGLEHGLRDFKMPQGKTILFQCLKGSRGQMACETCAQIDHIENDHMNLEGGIEAWKSEGLPTIGNKIKTAGISVFRQVQMVVGLLIAGLLLIGLTGVSLAFYIAIALSAALFVAGLTGFCGLAILLSKMPWNKTQRGT